MDIKVGEIGEEWEKGCSEDLPPFQDDGAGGILLSGCFFAARPARRMEKSTATGTSWRIDGYPGGELFSAKCSISERLTILSRRPGVRPSRFSRMEGQRRRWRCFPRIALLRSMMNMLSRFG